MSSLVEVILSKFPPITFAFSYGSAVTPQLGYSTLPITTSEIEKPIESKNGNENHKTLTSPLSVVALQLGKERLDTASTTQNRSNLIKPPMLDMIFAVENSKAWHASNLALNRSHYSFPWHFLGEGMIEAVQSKSGAGIWYNTLVPIPGASNGATMKYGVMSVDNLLDDLLNWRFLYAAGRLHKPVRIAPFVQGAVCDYSNQRKNDHHDPKSSSFAEGERREEIIAASRENLRHALRAALLMLPGEFSAEELYTAIAALSYNGDWRMVFGENPFKVSNIVAAQISLFHSLYGPILYSSFPSVSVSLGLNESVNSPHELLTKDLSSEDVRRLRFTQDTSLEARLALGLSLPVRVQKRMAEAQVRFTNDEDSKRATLRSSISYFVTGLSSSARSQTTTTLQESLNPSSLSPRKRIALVIAEEGRALLSRLQQQRLQVMIANKERWENRLRTVFRLRNSSKERTSSSPDGTNSRFVSSGNINLQHLLTSETDGTSSLHFSSAIGTPKVLNFWDNVVHNVTNKKSIGRTADIGPMASQFLKPSIANIVGSHARTQSLKGIVTAGPFKATAYAAEKLQKFFRALLFLKKR
jgi:hypothetical protein